MATKAMGLKEHSNGLIWEDCSEAGLEAALISLIFSRAHHGERTLKMGIKNGYHHWLRNCDTNGTSVSFILTGL